MIKITYSPVFKRKYKKLFRNNPFRQVAFQQKISFFLQDQFHPQLHTHKLSGNLKEFYSFSIEYDLRVIFYFVSEKEVVFDNIGSHDEVY
jgi:addiction module RelE/StbE family toxin